MRLDLVRDIVGVGGFFALCFGAWLVYPPAGFIVAGVLWLAFALFADGTRGIRR